MKFYLKVRWVVIGLFFGCAPMCSSFSPSCSCEPGEFQKPLPVEITALLQKFDCAQMPMAAFCFCNQDNNPVTLQDETKCCDASKKIEDDRVAAGMKREDSYKNPFNPDEHKKYAEGCCDIGQSKDCCLAFYGYGDVKTACAGPLPPPPPPPPPQGSLRPEVECGCVDPEDEIDKDETTGIVTCFPIKKTEQPAKGFCQLKDPAQSQSLSAAVVGITKEQLLQNVTTIEWTQSSGHEILKVDVAGGVTPLVPGGGVFKGVTTIAHGVKILQSDLPPDRIEYLLPFPKHDDKKHYEEYGVVMSVKDVNDVILNASTPTALRVAAEATGGGGCKAGGCSLMCVGP